METLEPALIGDARPSGLDAAVDRLSSLQHQDGSWQAEVVWSPVITAQAVIVQAITGHEQTQERRRLTLLHFERTVQPDGGWGLHPQSRSYVFVTTLVYIAARLLGARPEMPMLVAARKLLASNPDGIQANPQWGRFWLSLVGLYDRTALNACPPELFLLPRSSALSPMQFYCHTRYIYLAMACLSGQDFQADLGPIVDELRRELPGAVRTGASRQAVAVAASDMHEAPGPALNALYAGLRWAGPMLSRLPGASNLRKRAVAHCLDLIRYEQRMTAYQSLSPVSGLLNTLALFAADPNDPDVGKSLAGADFWRWQDEVDGSRYAGARSTAWDTSFALQALSRRGERLASDQIEAVRRGYRRLCAMQAATELPDREAQSRDINLGGWCFTEGAQAWPVSDCTAEAVIALTDCHAVEGLIPAAMQIAPTRLAEAATFILSRRNPDGGFGSYERRRGRRFLEGLNPSEMFGRCMTELTYVECTASSIRALHRILQTDAPVDRAKLEAVIARGVEILLSRQRDDGSWPGFWGINFVYGTLFALTALRDVGHPADNSAIRRARAWVEQRQQSDGGWGEHFDGCATDTFVQNPESLVITTAWATLALLHAGDEPSAAARRGADWLARRQLSDGDWPRDSVNGVFFGTAMLDYRLYNTYFPLMAVAGCEAARHG